MRGTLSFVFSKNNPVFGTEPFEVEFTVRPRIGEPFLFTSKFGFCNTSTVNAVNSENGELLIQTRNSLYKLLISEAKNG